MNKGGGKTMNLGVFKKKTSRERAGEVAQQLGALVALPGDLSSIPSTHLVAHNSQELQFCRIQSSFLDLWVLAHMQKNTHIHDINATKTQQIRTDENRR